MISLKFCAVWNWKSHLSQLSTLKLDERFIDFLEVKAKLTFEFIPSSEAPSLDWNKRWLFDCIGYIWNISEPCESLVDVSLRIFCEWVLILVILLKLSCKNKLFTNSVVLNCFEAWITNTKGLYSSGNPLNPTTVSSKGFRYVLIVRQFSIFCRYILKWMRTFSNRSWIS